MQTSRVPSKGRVASLCTQGEPKARLKSRHKSNRSGGASRSEGAALKTYEQKWQDSEAAIDISFIPIVKGHGHQAKATLVDALNAVGETEVAGLVARCCSKPIPGMHFLSIREHSGNKRHVGGLCHCGRSMLCPICAPYLMARRMEALTPVAAKLAQDPDLRHFSVVITVRHHLGAEVKFLIKVLRKMLKSMREGHLWRELVMGFIRLFESTFGFYGHHPHAHMILSLRVPDLWDPAPFFSWMKSLCEKQAHKMGRTCEWVDGWWSEVSPEALGVQVGYLGSNEKMGTALREVTSAASKHQPIWCIPPKAYAEIYRDTKGMRWFSVGGCWKTKETDKTDEQLDEERTTEGQEIAHMPAEVFNAWSPRARRDFLAVVCDGDLTKDQVLAHVLACGGGIGSPPDPWEPS